MKQLPEDFIKQVKAQFCAPEAEQFLQALDTPCPISIRWNDCADSVRQSGISQDSAGQVPWCPQGEYLSQRPSFTMDPLFHAGAYYVQEASSMFIWHLCQWLKDKGEWDSGIRALDLCAAPGGKSTLLLSVLTQGSSLIANEIMPKRAQILRENISKWTRQSAADVIVTNNSPADIAKLGSEIFDFILCDVPCSGEGMFRKDDEAIDDWSLQNVKMCQERQRSIVQDIWQSLRDGGFMIYSTCTYNSLEDEDNVRWIASELGAEIISVPVPEEWNVTPSPFYHFYPHKVKGEGFFCALLRKSVADNTEGYYPHCKKKDNKSVSLNTLICGNRKGKTPILKVLPLENIYEPPFVDVDSSTALRYLHGEAIVLPSDTPRGIVTITYKGLPLGQAKNIGSRANNLYPKEWRIRKQTVS